MDAVGVVELMDRRSKLRQFGLVLAALVLLIAGCATQSQKTMSTSPREPGRGGILHSGIALDSTDPLYSEYLDHVRKRIQEKWGYPCVSANRSCEYKSTSLEVEFGILKDGRLQYMEIMRSADFPIYDEYAATAIKLASPFPPVPPALMAVTPPGSTGIALRGRFIYDGNRQGQQLLR